MKKIIILFLGLLPLTDAVSQDAEINTLREKYVHWLVGENPDYENPYITIRYTYIIDHFDWASDFSDFDLEDTDTSWDLTDGDDKTELKKISERLIELCIIYNIPGPEESPNPYFEDSDVLELILEVFDFIEGKGLDGETDLGDYIDTEFGEKYGLGGTAINRSASFANSVLLMRDELLDAGSLEVHLEALDNFSYYWSPENPYFDFTYPGTNADGIKTIGEVRLIYILCQEDGSPDRITDMEHYVAFLNNGLSTSYGWSDMIKPDYTTYHHKGAYPSAYGGLTLVVAASLEWILANSAYEISATASHNLREALLAYSKFSIGYTVPISLTGRKPNSVNSLVEISYAHAMSYASKPLDNLACGEEFLRLFYLDSTLIEADLIKKRGVGVSLYHTLGGMEVMCNVLTEGLEIAEVAQGSFGFPYAGLSTYKKGNYMFTQKGTSKHIWHYEGRDDENAFGRYGSAGHIEVLKGNTGYSGLVSGISWDGYDWSHRPGTTVYNLTLDEIHEEAENDRMFNTKEFLVNAVFDSYGAFSMDYEDINSIDSMSLKKSSFMFDEYIICITNDIESNDPEHELHSTLFQTALSDVTAYTHIGLDSINGDAYSYETTSPGLALTDAVNNAYYIHENNGDQINIVRQLQLSIAEDGEEETEGYFTQAWVNHGVAPEAINLVYTMVVDGGAEKANFMAENFEDLFDLLELSGDLHAVQYLPDSTYAIAAFEANDSVHIGEILSVTAPAVLFSKKLSEEQLRIGFTDPNLGLLEEGEHYTYSDLPLTKYYGVPETNMVHVVVIGEWELEEASENVSLLFDGENTILMFTTKNGASEVCNLRKPADPGAINDFTLSTVNVFPVPATDVLYVNGENLEEGWVKMVDATGAVVGEWWYNGEENLRLSVSQLNAGLYFLILNKENTKCKVIITD